MRSEAAGGLGRVKAQQVAIDGERDAGYLKSVMVIRMDVVNDNALAISFHTQLEGP